MRRVCGIATASPRSSPHPRSEPSHLLLAWKRMILQAQGPSCATQLMANGSAGTRSSSMQWDPAQACLSVEWGPLGTASTGAEPSQPCCSSGDHSYLQQAVLLTPGLCVTSLTAGPSAAASAGRRWGSPPTHTHTCCSLESYAPFTCLLPASEDEAGSQGPAAQRSLQAALAQLPQEEVPEGEVAGAKPFYPFLFP